MQIKINISLVFFKRTFDYKNAFRPNGTRSVVRTPSIVKGNNPLNLVWSK